MDHEQDGFALDESLCRRLEEYARQEGLDPQEALETALGLGLEVCLGEAGSRESRLKHIESTLGDVTATLDVIGPHVFGVLMLLVAWAAREAFGVQEDELLAEIIAAARQEWSIAQAEHGVAVSEEPEA